MTRPAGWRTPLTSIVLLGLWLALGSASGPGQVLLGVLLAIAVPWLIWRLQAVQTRVRRPWTIVRYAGVVLLDVVVSNAQVGWGVIRGQRGPPRWDFVTVPLDLRDPAGLAMLALVTTLVPGTVWSELAPDSSMLLVHVWDVGDREAFIARYKSRYEQPLREIFE